MDVDDVFEKIGDFGTIQKKIFFPMNILTQCFVAFHVLIISFIGIDPDWSCTGSQDFNTKEPQLLFGSIDPKACELFETGHCKPQFEDGYTIVTSWNLICSKANYPYFSQSVHFVGVLLGAWLWGMAADKIGRKKVLFLSSAFMTFFGICTSLSIGYFSFTFFRFCIGINTSGVIISSYVLSIELVGKSARKLAGLFGAAAFALAYPVLAVLAYYIRNWRWLTLAVSIGYVVFFAMYRIIPESPRWLLVNGDTEGARRVLEYIATGNGTVMPKGDLKTGRESSAQGPSITDLFTRRIVGSRTLKLMVIWFSVCLSYYGLTMSSSELGRNVYVSFSLSGLIELPSLFLGYKMLGCVGRRWTHGGFLLTAGAVGVLHSILYWLGSGYLGIIAAFIGKFSVAAAFGILYLYTAELYPTQVRNIGVGMCSLSARLGGIMAPLVLLTAHLDRGVPMLIIGCLCFLSGIIGLSLPETRDRPMVDTISELENQNIWLQ